MVDENLYNIFIWKQLFVLLRFSFSTYFIFKKKYKSYKYINSKNRKLKNINIKSKLYIWLKCWNVFEFISLEVHFIKFSQAAKYQHVYKFHILKRSDILLQTKILYGRSALFKVYIHVYSSYMWSVYLNLFNQSKNILKFVSKINQKT